MVRLDFAIDKNERITRRYSFVYFGFSAPISVHGLIGREEITRCALHAARVGLQRAKPILCRVTNFYDGPLWRWLSIISYETEAHRQIAYCTPQYVVQILIVNDFDDQPPISYEVVGTIN